MKIKQAVEDYQIAEDCERAKSGKEVIQQCAITARVCLVATLQVLHKWLCQVLQFPSCLSCHLTHLLHVLSILQTEVKIKHDLDNQWPLHETLKHAIKNVYCLFHSMHTTTTGQHGWLALFMLPASSISYHLNIELHTSIRGPSRVYLQRQ